MRRPGELGLYVPRKAAARIAAARAAAVGYGVPDFVINARTDVYMRRIGDPQTRLDEVLRRGADVRRSGRGLPVRAWVGGPGRAGITRRAIPPADQRVHRSRSRQPSLQLRAAGVRRVSVGPALTQAAYTVTRQLAGELLRVGRLTTESPCLDYALLNSLFSTPDLREE